MNKIAKYLQRSFMMLSTNPRLTTNIKVVTDGNSLYLDSFGVNSIISADKYKSYKISPNGLYNKDVCSFWKNTPLNFVYDFHTILDSGQRVADYRQQIEDTYNTGVRPLTSSEYGKGLQFRILAPLWMSENADNIPDYFLIFRIPGPALSQKEKSVSEIFDREIIDKAVLVKSVNLKYETNIGKYIRNYVSQKERISSGIYADFSSKGMFSVYGISLETGDFIKAPCPVYNKLMSVERTLTEERELYTSMFRDNSVVFSDIMNLEFLFDDPEAEDFSMNRYFGIYADFYEDGRFTVTGHKENILYGISDSGNMFPNTLVNPDIFSENSIFCISDKEGNLKSVDREAENDKDNTVIISSSVDIESVSGKKSIGVSVPIEECTETDFAMNLSVEAPMAVYTKLEVGIASGSSSNIQYNTVSEYMCSENTLGNSFSSEEEKYRYIADLYENLKKLCKDTPIEVSRKNNIISLTLKSRRKWYFRIADDIYNSINISEADNSDGSVSHVYFFFNPKPVNGYLYCIGKNYADTQMSLKEGQFFKGASGKFITLLSVKENKNTWFIVTDEKIDKSIMNKCNIYSEYIMPYGRLDLYPVKSFENDFYCSLHRKMGEIHLLNKEILSRYESNNESSAAAAENENTPSPYPQQGSITLHPSSDLISNDFTVNVSLIDRNNGPMATGIRNIDSDYVDENDGDRANIVIDIILYVDSNSDSSLDPLAYSTGIYKDIFPLYNNGYGPITYDEYEKYSERENCGKIIYPVDSTIHFVYKNQEKDVYENPLLLNTSPIYGQSSFCNTVNNGGIENKKATFERLLPYVFFDPYYYDSSFEEIVSNNYSMLGALRTEDGSNFLTRKDIISRFTDTEHDWFFDYFYRIFEYDSSDTEYIVPEYYRNRFSTVYKKEYGKNQYYTMFRGTEFSLVSDIPLDNYLFSFAAVPENVYEGRQEISYHHSDFAVVCNNKYKTITILLFVKASVGNSVYLSFDSNRELICNPESNEVNSEAWVQMTGRVVSVEHFQDNVFVAKLESGYLFNEISENDEIFISRYNGETASSIGNHIIGKVSSIADDNTFYFISNDSNIPVPAFNFNMVLMKKFSRSILEREFSKIDFSNIYSVLELGMSEYDIIVSKEQESILYSSKSDSPLSLGIASLTDSLRLELVKDENGSQFYNSLIQRHNGSYIPLFKDILVLNPSLHGDSVNALSFLSGYKDFARLKGLQYTRAGIDGPDYGFHDINILNSHWDYGFVMKYLDKGHDMLSRGTMIAEDIAGWFLSKQIKLVKNICFEKLDISYISWSLSEDKKNYYIQVKIPDILENYIKEQVSDIFSQYDCYEDIDSYVSLILQRYVLSSISLFMKKEHSDIGEPINLQYVGVSDSEKEKAGLEIQKDFKCSVYKNTINNVIITIPAVTNNMLYIGFSLEYSSRQM